MSNSPKQNEKTSSDPPPPAAADRLSDASVAEILRSAGGNRGVASFMPASGTASVFGRAGAAASTFLQGTTATSNINLAHASGLGPAAGASGLNPGSLLGGGLSAGIGGGYSSFSLAELSQLSRLQQGQQNFLQQSAVQARAQQLFALEQAASEARSIALFARLQEKQVQQPGSFKWLIRQQQQLQQQPSIGMLLERQRLMQGLQVHQAGVGGTDHTELARTLASMGSQPRTAVVRAPADSTAASLGKISARASLAEGPTQNQPKPQEASMFGFNSKKDKGVLKVLINSPDSSSSTESLGKTLASARKVETHSTVEGRQMKRSSLPSTMTVPPNKKKKSSISRTFSSSMSITTADQKYATPHFTQREPAPLGIDEDNNWLSSFQCYGTFACSLRFVVLIC